MNTGILRRSNAATSLNLRGISLGRPIFRVPVVCGFWPWFFSAAALFLYLVLAQVAWSTSYDLICV